MGRTWLKTQVRLESRYTELVGAGMPLWWLEGTLLQVGRLEQ